MLASLHSTGNYWEAGFWGAIALGFAVAAIRRRGNLRRLLLIAALTLAAFGGSDLVEVRTGAWWRPWWLLAWKALCVAAMLWLYCAYQRTRVSRTSCQRSRGDLRAPVETDQLPLQ